MTLKKKKCMYCGQEVKIDASFCTNCGKPFPEEKNMYCSNCGAPLSEEMRFCTKCGVAVTRDGYCSLTGKLKDHKIYFDFEKKSGGKIILKILTLVMIICFFCPMFLFSCYGTEAARMSGFEMATGAEIMGEEVEGEVVFIFFLILPVAALICLFIKSREWKLERLAVTLSGTGGLSLILVYRTLLSRIKESQGSKVDYEYLEIGIKALGAFYVYVIAAIIITLVGTYLYCQYEIEKCNNNLQTEERNIYTKCILSMLGSIVIGTGIIMILFIL